MQEQHIYLKTIDIHSSQGVKISIEITADIRTTLYALHVTGGAGGYGTVTSG